MWVHGVRVFLKAGRGETTNILLDKEFNLKQDMIWHTVVIRLEIALYREVLLFPFVFVKTAKIISFMRD